MLLAFGDDSGIDLNIHGTYGLAGAVLIVVAICVVVAVAASYKW